MHLRDGKSCCCRDKKKSLLPHRFFSRLHSGRKRVFKSTSKHALQLGFSVKFAGLPCNLIFLPRQSSKYGKSLRAFNFY
jgi:hypothetical protein